MRFKALFGFLGIAGIAATLVTTFVTTTALAAAASDPVVYGRTKRFSPGYYSNTTAEFTVKYMDDELPDSTRAYLRYGFGGVNAGAPIKWQYTNEVEMLTSGHGRFHAVIEQIMQARSSSMQLDSLDFVIRVALPGGESYYVKGSESPMGFYRSYIDVFNSDFEWSPMIQLEAYPITDDYLLNLRKTRAINTEACVDLNGDYEYQEPGLPLTSLKVVQDGCKSVSIWQLIKDGDSSFEFFDKFKTDGVFRRFTDPAPYASYEMAQFVGDMLQQVRMSVHVRRNKMQQVTITHNVRRTTDGGLKITRVTRGDDSEVIRTEERVYLRVAQTR